MKCLKTFFILFIILDLITCKKNSIKEYSPIIVKPKNPYEEYNKEYNKEYEIPNVPIYNNLQLVIDYSKYNHNNTFKINENIYLICTIININNNDEEIYLKDHHDYHGTLDYPTSIYITIEDEYGKKIIDEYTDYFCWSTEFKEMPDDWILLKNNETIIRKLSINKILGNEQKNILNNIGKYNIFITLKYYDKKTKLPKKYVSNGLKLYIIE
jgi:hypothetical protein